MSETTRRDALKMAVVGSGALALSAALGAKSQAAEKKPSAGNISQPTQGDYTDSDIDTYETVSQIIGINMDYALKKILSDLAQRAADGQGVDAIDGKQAVTNSQLKTWFKVLSGTTFHLAFHPLPSKPRAAVVYSPADITKPDSNDASNFISGVVRFSGEIRF